MIKPLLHPDFNAPRVRYGFFGRKGGVSGGVYASLNARMGSDDNPDHVRENRKRIVSYFGLDITHINNCYQEHGNHVVVLNENLNDERPKGDALITDKSNIAIGVLTADCTPVLFHAQKQDGSPIIAAVHAGWRGAVDGVLDNTVLELMRADAIKDTITACIGPTIHQKSYEVDQKFYESFITQNRDNVLFFMENPARPTHYLFNLPAYCAERLKAIGITHGYDVGVDTYSNPDDYFSFRRSTHQGETEYGGQISVIMIE